MLSKEIQSVMNDLECDEMTATIKVLEKQLCEANKEIGQLQWENGKMERQLEGCWDWDARQEKMIRERDDKIEKLEKENKKLKKKLITKPKLRIVKE